MKHTLKISLIATLLAVSANAAGADCTVEYKAKQDNPLRLEHGTVQVAGPCTMDEASLKAAALLAERGWTLLKVLSVSGT